MRGVAHAPQCTTRARDEACFAVTEIAYDRLVVNHFISICRFSMGLPQICPADLHELTHCTHLTCGFIYKAHVHRLRYDARSRQKDRHEDLLSLDEMLRNKAAAPSQMTTVPLQINCLQSSDLWMLFRTPVVSRCSRFCNMAARVICSYYVQ